MTKSARNRKKTAATPAPPTPEPVLDAAGQDTPLSEPPAPPAPLDPNFEPGYTRRIEIRLALPTPQVRYVQGKPVRDPAPDPERLMQAIQPDLLRLVDEHYGPHTELVVATASSPGVRITGNFGEKASETQGRVTGWLDAIFEHLDLSE